MDRISAVEPLEGLRDYVRCKSRPLWFGPPDVGHAWSILRYHAEALEESKLATIIPVPSRVVIRMDGVVVGMCRHWHEVGDTKDLFPDLYWSRAGDEVFVGGLIVLVQS